MLGIGGGALGEFPFLTDLVVVACLAWFASDWTNNDLGLTKCSVVQFFAMVLHLSPFLL